MLQKKTNVINIATLSNQLMFREEALFKNKLADSPKCVQVYI